MNRAEATLALIAGKPVERVFPGCLRADPLRWHASHGLQFQSEDGKWMNESGDDLFYEYREVWQARVFLDRWIEVKTFEEAEPAGEYYGKPIAFRVRVRPDTAEYIEGFPADTDTAGYWVRRKPDAGNTLYGSPAAEAENDRLHESVKLLDGLLLHVDAQWDAAEKHVKLLNGLLDEVLTKLDNCWSGVESHKALAESIRARRDGK